MTAHQNLNPAIVILRVAHEEANTWSMLSRTAGVIVSSCSFHGAEKGAVNNAVAAPGIAAKSPTVSAERTLLVGMITEALVSGTNGTTCCEPPLRWVRISLIACASCCRRVHLRMQNGDHLQIVQITQALPLFIQL